MTIKSNLIWDLQDKVGQYWLPLSCTVSTLICWLCLQPVEAIPAIAGSDKLQHLIAYAFLAIPVSVSNYQFKREALVLFFCLGVVIEFIQPMTGRTFDAFDVLFNTFGLVLGFLTSVFATRLRSTAELLRRSQVAFLSILRSVNRPIYR